MAAVVEPVRLDDAFMQDPHAMAEIFRREGPARQVVMPRGLRGWVITGYHEARALLADPRLSKNSARISDLFQTQVDDKPDSEHVGARPFASALTAHMLNSDPPEHTRLRKLVNKAFTPKSVDRLRPRIEQITDELLDRMSGEVDLLEAFAFPLPITVICELLGVPETERAQFRDWSNTLVSADPAAPIEKAAGELVVYLRELIERKRAEPGPDLLSDLVEVSEDGDRLGEHELVPMVFLLLIAGHETTVNLIGNAVLALLRNPDQLAALRADPSLLPGAVEEFLRLDGPVNLATLRFTTEPVRVGEVVIGEGEFVLISLLAANRDGERFEEPAKLDLKRPTGGHLAFGHGIHYCVGAPLARMEAEIAIGRLLARFDGLALAGEPSELRWRASTLMHGLEALPVRLG
ncbi:cytochrome P450 [Amycolatopsis sp. 195334CR]|uniref:cytochrome P450 family protein n=1 Tax=Amycolatopsis sp. 195334CR TaxID=2814588 RepID=UPI001A8FFBDC|nr:cytochrome P450 [Amycolatopsis sp. 195334CR]MBN6041764.1 cytochrome P450 [Amycolatopsis sp. 195334CR]